MTLSSGTISFTNDGFIGQAISIQDKGYVRMEDAYKTAFGIADGKDGKMTFLCWYNPSKFVTDGNPLTTNKDWTAGKNVGLVIDAQNKGASGLRFNIGDGRDALNINPNPAVPSTVNEWQFVAITADLSTNQANLYYGTADGELQLKGSGNTSSIDSLLSNFNYWFIGIDNSGNHYFNGRIDEAGYWNRALSFDEINQIYTAQKAGTSLASQVNLTSSASTVQAGAFADASTWAGGVAPSVDANVVMNHAVTSDSRTFNGEAVIGADGSLTAAGCVYVGHSNDGAASLTINGGENVFSGKTHNKLASSLIIGYEGGVGKLILNDGTVTTSGYTYVGYTSTEGSEFIQTGGTFNSGDNIGLAYHANEVGSMLISGGEMNVNGAIRIAIEANSTGQMTVSGGKVNATNFQIGRAGAGEAAKLTITGGVVEVTGAIYGSGGANSGNLSISGTGQLVFNSTTTDNGIRELTSFQVEGSGSDGTGALLFKQSLKSAAPMTLTGNTTIGIEPGATFTQTAVISGTETCGLTITGGGTMELTAKSTYTGATTVEAGTLSLTEGGTLYNLSGGSATQAANVNAVGKELALVNRENTQFFGSITAAGITKSGEGTLKLNGTITASSLTVTGGEFDLLGSSTGGLTIDGAVFSPGNSVGAAEVNGAFTLTNGASVIMEIGGATPDKNDKLVATGDLQLGDGKICLTLADACDLQPGGEFTAVFTGSNSASIENFVNKYVVSHYFTNLAYVPYGEGQYAITGIFNANAIPEPAAWILLLLGTFGLMYWRKRK
ncbi:MAG: PEP-CTERM sorting domain-containing protein [Thermoguttaceae bacterium]|nr:PEP-CTERM sorting domain-containing protein [Thermoguttaceae bacterium]